MNLFLALELHTGRTHSYESTTVKKRGAAVEDETKHFQHSLLPRFEVLVSIGPIRFHFFTSYWSDYFYLHFLSVITNQLDTILKSEQKIVHQIWWSPPLSEILCNLFAPQTWTSTYGLSPFWHSVGLCSLETKVFSSHNLLNYLRINSDPLI